MSLGKEFLTELEIQEIRKRVTVAISPLQSADKSVPYFYGRRTLAGHKLPPYYLVYFFAGRFAWIPSWRSTGKSSMEHSH
jgi:hypothetical protein